LIYINSFTDVHQRTGPAIAVTSVLKDVKLENTEVTMNSESYEEPGIDYFMILTPIMFWVIFIFEALAGRQ